MRRQDKRRTRDRCITGVEHFRSSITFPKIGEMVGSVLSFLAAEGLAPLSLTVNACDVRVVFYRCALEDKAKAEPYIISRFPEKNTLAAFATWYVHRALHLWIDSQQEADKKA